jgi:hypothetical protein|tara:strand:+ start:1219 stop:1503 length:285 start_codon:yes stop_codon:yes gene_type:complete
MGVGAFNNNDDLKSVNDAVSQILNSGKPANEMPDGVEMSHIMGAANDVLENAVTFEDRTKIITKHLLQFDPTATSGNAVAFEREVLKQISESRR